MAKLIVICNAKGGVGKTTLCINLAHSCKHHVPTALADLDPQGSVRDMAPHFNPEDDDGDNFSLLPYSTGLLQAGYQLVIVDTPPYLVNELPTILAQANLAIIPVKPGPADIAASRRTVALIKEVQKKTPGLKAAFVINMVRGSKALTEAAVEALRQYGLPIFKARLGDRTDFTRSVALRHGIYSTGNRKAKQEFDAFAKEILTTFLL